MSVKTLVQCDFDGTVTEEDVSFLLLDTFAKPRWRRLFRDYEQDRISVGRFNTQSFSMVKASRNELMAVVMKNFDSKIRIREGFLDLIACCRRKGFRLVIISNGLQFYIEEILKHLGVADIEVFAAKTNFDPKGLKVQYVGPDGHPVDNGFKEAYLDSFLAEGYRVIYVGNGSSDILPARRAHYIFATGSLLSYCQETNLSCLPFTRFNEVVQVLETLA